MVDPVSISALVGLALAAIVYFVQWMRNGGQSSCNINQVAQTATKVSEVLELISKLKEQVDDLKKYSINENRHLQAKVDSLEEQIRLLNEHLLSPKT